MLTTISIHTVGAWLGITNVGDAKAAAYQIANATCQLRVFDLLTNPNSTITEPFSDVMGKFEANCYLHNYYMFAVNVEWNDANLNCDDCVFGEWLLYFSNIENVIEILSTIALVVTTYYTAVVYGMLNRTLANCPMVDLQYNTNPAQISDTNVHELEVQALNMMERRSPSGSSMLVFRHTSWRSRKSLPRIVKKVSVTRRTTTHGLTTRKHKCLRNGTSRAR